MFHLVYVSSAVQSLKNDELVELLTKAREKNRRLDITGMLLYKDGSFMQVLEGEESGVRGLFASISADQSHQGIIVLLEDPLAKPLFSGWSMGFRNLADPEVLALPGFSRFMNSALNADTFEDDPTGCMGLLNLFRENG